MSFLMINSPLYRDPAEEYDEVLPPIGLGYICTDLQNNGIAVELLDAVAGKISIDKIVGYIDKGDFTHIGLNVFSTNHKLVEEIVIKTKRNVKFVLGGAFTKTNYKNIAAWEAENKLTVVIGEGDYIVKDIVRGNVSENPYYTDGGNEVYKVDKDSVYFPSDISNIPLDRNFFQYEPVLNSHNGKKEGNIVVSRGCFYNCAFCAAAISLNKGTKIRTRSIECVRSEIQMICDKNPDIKSIRVLDDLFLKNPRSILMAADMFDSFDITWRAMAHIQSFKKITFDLLLKLKASGCEELSIGIESGNQDILNKINKPNTVMEIKDTIVNIFKSGIGVKGYFIFGFPDETKEQFEDTYNLAEYLKRKSIEYGVLFRASVFQFRPYHGTQLYNDMMDRGVKLDDITPNGDLGENSVKEYDFSSGNFSYESYDTLKEFINKTRALNDMNGIH